MAENKVSIRPGVKMLSVLKHLNYRPWFALAEFVDNSLQSYLTNKQSLIALEGDDYKLKVSIDIDPNDNGRIVIRDNAAGISKKDFGRAFRPAEIPTDSSGLSEFGMGMKSAACWFSPNWHVRTSALDEPTEKTISFDIDKIVNDDLDEIDVSISKCKLNNHFTEIILDSPYNIPASRTLGKVKEHLRDIYRIFVRENILNLKFNGEDLVYEEPEVLVAPYYKNEDDTDILWRKNINFDFGKGLQAVGFAAIRKQGSVSKAGFSLFRRNRLIQGSGDEGYRPEYIFGKSNSFIYQRVFGELHLDGFQVSHTKDGFKWDENEEPFLEILKDELSSSDMPLLKQAREYRHNRPAAEYTSGAEQANDSTADSIKEHAPEALSSINSKEVEDETSESLDEAIYLSRREIEVNFLNNKWQVIIELTHDPAVGDWLEVGDHILTEEEASLNQGTNRVIGIRLSLNHPFMERFGGTDKDEIEPLLRIAASLGLAEVAARNGGMRYAGLIRTYINELLKNALSRT